MEASRDSKRPMDVILVVIHFIRLRRAHLSRPLSASSKKRPARAQASTWQTPKSSRNRQETTPVAGAGFPKLARRAAVTRLDHRSAGEKMLWIVRGKTA